MSWAGCSSNQFISFTDAQGSGITQLYALPTSNQFMTKTDAIYYLNIDTSYMSGITSTQWPEKSQFVAGTTTTTTLAPTTTTTTAIPTTTTTTSAGFTTTTTTTHGPSIIGIWARSSVATIDSSSVYYSLGSSGTDMLLGSVSKNLCGFVGNITVPFGVYLHIGILKGGSTCITFNAALATTSCPATSTGYCGTVNASCSGGFVTPSGVTTSYSIALNVDTNGTIYTTC